MPQPGHDDADPFDLDRFVRAQESVHERAISELRAGRKRSHWMWFVFPQVAGLGSSPTARKFALRSADEAAAYLEHPVLGPRLHAAVEAVRTAGRNDPNLDARSLLGSPDDLKLRSSMTLFASVAEHPQPFVAVIDRYYGGQRDEATLRFLGTS